MPDDRLQFAVDLLFKTPTALAERVTAKANGVARMICNVSSHPIISRTMHAVQLVSSQFHISRAG